MMSDLRKKEQWGWVRQTSASVMKPFDVYAQFPASAESFLPLDLTNTGISDVVERSVFSSAVYNVMGQRVSGAKKGLVIQNGKLLIKR